MTVNKYKFLQQVEFDYEHKTKEKAIGILESLVLYAEAGKLPNNKIIEQAKAMAKELARVDHL